MTTENKRPEGRQRTHPRVATPLGDAILAYRVRRRMSLVTLAREVGVPARTLAGWESDGRAPLGPAREALRACMPGLARILDRLPTQWSRRPKGERGVTGA